MKVAVVGAGAMGGLFGGLLAEAGHQVLLVDVDPAVLQEIGENGLLLQTDSGARRVALPAVRPDAACGVVDLLLAFTKGPATEAAMRGVAALVGPQTRALTVQNGLGNAERIAAALPGVRVLVGMTNWPADARAPGHVVSHGHGHVRIWSMDGAADRMVPEIAAALDGAGLDCVADPEVEVAIWEKVAFNAAMNSVSAVARVAVGPLGDAPSGRALVRQVVEEVLDVAQARGLAVGRGRVHAAVQGAFEGHRSHKASMLQDVLAGRPTEIEEINGAVASIGAGLGVPTPVTTVLRDLVRLVDHAARRSS